MRYMKMTVRGGDHRIIPLYTADPSYREYEPVVNCTDENHVRRLLAVLGRMVYGRSGTGKPIYTLGDLHDYYVTVKRHNGKQVYTLFVRGLSCNGCSGHGAWLAGILFAYSKFCRRERRRIMNLAKRKERE